MADLGYFQGLFIIIWIRRVGDFMVYFKTRLVLIEIESRKTVCSFADRVKQFNKANNFFVKFKL